MINLFKTNRMIFIGATPPESISSTEAPSDVPQANEITKEHVENVLNAVDRNINTIKEYYKDYVTTGLSGEQMPEEISNQLKELKTLKTKLDQMRSNPPNSRDTLVKIYDIFASLDAYAEKTVEDAKNDPNPLRGLGIIAGIYRPKLEAEQPVVAEEEGETRLAESNEVTKEKLVLAAVENIARAGGELTQPMLDALRKYKPGESPLRFDINIEGNPVTLFVERTVDGFAAVGGVRNEEQLTPSQAPTWKMATFNFRHSFNADDENAPAVNLRSADEYAAMAEKGELPSESTA